MKFQSISELLRKAVQPRKVTYTLLHDSSTAEATEIGLDLGLSESTIKRFLQDAQLFKKAKHGKYLKTISS